MQIVPFDPLAIATKIIERFKEDHYIGPMTSEGLGRMVVIAEQEIRKAYKEQGLCDPDALRAATLEGTK